MASESDSPVDQLRTLINSMAGLPNLADDFTEEQLQKLAAAGYRRAQQFGRVNREELQALGIPLALAADLQAGIGGVAATADSMWSQRLEAGLAEIRAGLAGLNIKLQIAKEALTYISGSKLGCSIEAMPSFQKAAAVSELFAAPTPEQWTAFFAALGLPEQPDSVDWAELLYQRKLDARRSKKRKADDELGYASSAPPTTFPSTLGPEEKVQLAVGCITRALESAGMTKLHWRDTSRCGVINSSHMPDFTGFVYGAQGWASVGVVMEVRDVLSGEKMHQAWGRVALGVGEQFDAKPSRQKAFAVAAGRDSVDIVVATKLESSVVTYQHSQEHALRLNRESPGLRHLVATVTASAEASGYMTMDPPAHTPSHCVYVGPSVPLRYTVSDQTSTTSPCGTQVHPVNIKKRKGQRPEAAILKIPSPELVMAEASNLMGLKSQGLADRCTTMVESGRLSEELERIYNSLTGLSPKDGVMRWQRSMPGDSVAKIAAVMNGLPCLAEVLQCTRDDLRPLVEALHDLFLPTTSSFVAWPSKTASVQMRGFHHTDVGAAESLKTLDSCDLEDLGLESMES